MDIKKDEVAVHAINAILENKGIAEVKIERGNITVVEIKRTVKTPRR